MADTQMTLDGSDPPKRPVPSHASFSPSQRALLKELADRGELRSMDAGRIVHLHRQPPCVYCRNDMRCPWVSSDGGDAMKRLMARGVVQRGQTLGVWKRVVV